MNLTTISQQHQDIALTASTRTVERTGSSSRNLSDEVSLRFSSSSARISNRLDSFASELASEPSLLRMFLAVVELLEGFDSSVAEQFVERLSQSLGIDLDTSAGGAARSAEFRRLDIRVETVSRSTSFASSSRRASLSTTVERVRISVEVETLAVFSRRGEEKKIDPIVLDLDGEGLRLSGLEDGVVFDLDADGRLDLTAFIGEGDGLLALDRNGNGRIDDGGELFGDQRGAANGFEELRKLDADGNGRVDRYDPGFASLGVVVRNGDRLGFQSLDEVGVESISLDYRDDYSPLLPDATVAQRGSFTHLDGSQGEAADVLFSARPLFA